MRKIPCVAHGNHGIVKETKIPLAINGDERCPVDKDNAPEQKSQREKRNDLYFSIVSRSAIWIIHHVYFRGRKTGIAGMTYGNFLASIALLI